MSLQVWLPFNGDSHNQGLAEISITNNSTTINNNGKIGKCLHFSNTEYITMTPGFLPETGKEFSCCYWVKELSNNTVTNFRVVYECGQLIIGQYGDKFNVWQTNSGVDVMAVIDSTTWVHCCVTVDATGLCKIYTNGQYQTQKTISTYPSTGTTTIGRRTIGGTNANSDFLINDFRIYDHCLSAKEVEEISKGLILHYKLDNDGLGNPNLALHTRDLHVVSSKDNLNMFVRGSVTRQLRPDGFYESKATASWRGLSFWANQLNLTPGTKVTYSFYIYTNGSSRAFSFYPMMYDSAGTRDTSTGLPISIDGGPYTTVNAKAFPNTTATTPEYHYVTFEWNQAVADIISNGGSIELSIQVHGNWASGDWASIFAPKVEFGDRPTLWCPHSSELLFNNNIIYDSSGYNNNGIIINELSLINSSPRYDNARHFSATNQKIKISNLSTIGFTNSYSFAWWEKISSVTPMHWGFADGIRLNGMYTGRLWNTGDGSNNPLYKSGTTTQVAAPTVNVWHHWVMTGNGTKCLVYQDGELWAEAKTYKSITGTTIYLNGWAEATDYSSNDASMSDFRIYSTALTADQVKELYNTSATIDKNGNIYARKQIENLDNINITKTGQLQSNKIVDSDDVNIASFKKSDKSINGNTVYEY